MKPNLFKYAPGELSQDAVICWLFEWSDPSNSIFNENLHQLGSLFVQSLFAKFDIDTPKLIDKIVIKKQYKYIDIVCEINGTFLLLIEDKTNTRARSNQLETNLKTGKDDYATFTILPLYFKTGDQSNYDHVVEMGYKTYLRNDFLNVLQEGNKLGITDPIFLSYYEFLFEIETKRSNFLEQERSSWDHDTWIGFFKRLRIDLGDGDWSYVSNRSGGFMGFWWNRIVANGHTLYCQLEENCFVLKIDVGDVTNRSEIRRKYDNLLAGVDFSDEFDPPKRRATGRFMTLGKLKSDHGDCDNNGIDRWSVIDKNGLMDFGKTVKSLRSLSKKLQLLSLKVDVD